MFVAVNQLLEEVVEVSSDEDEDPTSYWIPDLLLKDIDQQIIISSESLNDNIINAYQKLLKRFPQVEGLETTLYCEQLKCAISNSQQMVQVINVSKSHWVCATTTGCAKGSSV